MRRRIYCRCVGLLHQGWQYPSSLSRRSSSSRRVDLSRPASQSWDTDQGVPWTAGATALFASISVFKQSTQDEHTGGLTADKAVGKSSPSARTRITDRRQMKPVVIDESDQNSASLLDALRLVGRASELAVLGAPLALVLPYRAVRYAATGDHRHAYSAYKWIGWFLENAGCAFAKGAQWASMREDLFPRDLCVELRSLRDDTSKHSFAHTQREIEETCGRSLSDIFVDIDMEPVASGSVAQVHKATLRAELSPSGEPTEVAVKVRHPGVKRVLQQDLDLASAALETIRAVPGLDQLTPPVALDEFSAVLRRQADLRLEAANLRSFGANFEGRPHLHVRFPRPIDGLVGESVLVETWEEGCSIQDFVDVSSRFNVGLASRGYDIFLNMLLVDNLMHGDTHSGNIFCRLRDQKTGEVVNWRPVGGGGEAKFAVGRGEGRGADFEQSSSMYTTDAAGHVEKAILESSRGGLPSQGRTDLAQRRKRTLAEAAWDACFGWWLGYASADDLVAEMVVLDAGLVTTLSREGRHHLRQLLLHIFLADGAAAADQFIALSRGVCSDASGFRRDMDILFANTCGSKVMRGATNVGQLIREMIALVNAYSMQLESEFANVVVSLATLEGLARSLDPEIDVIRRLGPFFAREITGVVTSAVREDLGIRSVEDFSPAATLARVVGGVFRKVPEMATGFWGAEG